MGPKPRGGTPRLKTCVSCGTLNAPRQFYCTQCSTGFYSEEKLANRVVGQTVPAVCEEAIALDESVINAFIKKIAYTHKSLNFGSVSGSPICVCVTDEEAKESVLSLCAGECAAVSNGNLLLNVGRPCKCLALADDCLAVLTDDGQVCVWEHVSGGFRYMHTFRCVEECVGLPTCLATGISFVENMGSHLIFVVCTQKIILVETSTGRIFWELDNDQLYTCGVARFSGDTIEILVGVNEGPIRLFGIDSGGSIMYEDAFFSKFSATCMHFLGSLSPYFVAGYTHGEILLWDTRSSVLCINSTSTLAGIRRWLGDLCVSNGSVFAGFQTGAIVNLGAEIIPIGGDPKNAQCWNVAGIGPNIFAAMSSGVVLTLDTSLREKLRRPMTGYLSRWTVYPQQETTLHTTTQQDTTLHTTPQPSLAETVVHSLLHPRLISPNVYVEIFSSVKAPANLKFAKSGATNEPPAGPRPPISVNAIRASGNIIAEGTEAGIVRISRFSAYTHERSECQKQ